MAPDVNLIGRLAALLVSSMAISSCAHATADGIVFFTGSVASVEDVPEPQQGRVSVDGTYDVKFNVSRILIGDDVDLDRPVRYFGAKPAPGGEFYILMKKGGGRPQLLWLEVKWRGVCVSTETAQKYGIEEQMQQLRRRYPCKR